jgi:CheY-specific phosphatase CheX
MSNANNNQQFAKSVLDAYSAGWEELVCKAGLTAVSGSTGLEMKEVSRDTASNLAVKPNDGVYVSSVSGLISINAGKVIGNINITFSKGAILKIASTVYEKQMDDLDRMVLDCAGELTNITYGLFKRGTSEKGFDLMISLPSVVMGSHDVISLKADKFFRVTYDLGGFPLMIKLTLTLEN